MKPITALYGRRYWKVSAKAYHWPGGSTGRVNRMFMIAEVDALFPFERKSAMDAANPESAGMEELMWEVPAGYSRSKTR